MKVQSILGLAITAMLLGGCAHETYISIRSEPSRARLYSKADDPKFRAMAAAGQGGLRETPTSMTGRWDIIKADSIAVKVIWPDGVESKVVTLKRNSPDVDILFIKGQEPQVNVEGKR